MALWGNNDSKTASGTVSIASTGVVTGSSTAFTTQAKIGNTIKTSAGVEYQIVTITSDTVALVIMGTNNGNGTVTTASGLSYTLSEKPASVAHESADSGVGVHGNSSKVFGVDTTEQSAGGDNVTNVAVAGGGARYLGAAPAVTSIFILWGCRIRCCCNCNYRWWRSYCNHCNKRRFWIYFSTNCCYR